MEQSQPHYHEVPLEKQLESILLCDHLKMLFVNTFENNHENENFKRNLKRNERNSHTKKERNANQLTALAKIKT